MRPNRTLLAVALGLALVSWLPALAQRGDDADRASKNGKVVADIGETRVTVEYGRPRGRGREIFGHLVPFGEVWAPGANEATEVTFSTAVVIENQLVPGGTYTLWAIPDEKEWTLTLNTETGIWHTAHKAEHDKFRFTVRPQPAEHFEVLTFVFTEVTPDSANLVLHWDEVAIPLVLTIPQVTITTD